ncbi:MAG TPA: hypothetical protein VFJ30_07135, partial [Phycisphaerae bacterium]|nr:hypothetical protein [Phycisphaerae bacterium]
MTCKSRLLLVAGVLLANALTARAEGPPVWTYEDFKAKKIPQTYTVRQGHPRLLITPDNQPEIIAKAKAAPKLFQAVIEVAEKGKGEPAALA